MRTTDHRLGEVGVDPDAPPMEVRMELAPGDLAMLLDQIAWDDVQPFWVEIDQVLGPGVYLGVTERGSAVEFSADHIADLEYARGPSLGMPWYDAFRPSTSRPKQAPAGVFRHFAPGPRQQPGSPPPQPQAPRKSVFDVFKGFFRGRPTPEITPIPPSEHRQTREQHSFRLPPVRLAPGSGTLTVPERTEAPPAPPAVRASLAPIPDAAIPVDLFSVLAQESERPPVSITPIAPPPSPSPGAVIMAPAQPGAPQADIFQMLVPEEKARGTISMAPNPFDLLAPEPPKESFGPPGMALDPFSMLAPEGPSPFDLLTGEPPAPSGGMVVRESPSELSTESMFDILKPEPESPAAPPPPPPTMESLYDALKQGDEPEQKQKPRARKKEKAGAWRMPDHAEWVAWVKQNFDLNDLWRHIRAEQKDEYFIEAQQNEETSDSGPVMTIETWAQSDWDAIFEYFGIPPSVWQPYTDKIAHDEETDGYADEAWEELQMQILQPLSTALAKAFKAVQPKDVPGSFILGDDYDMGVWGLLYYEPLPPNRKQEIERARQKFEREQAELQKERKKQLKQIWGPMPKPEDLVPWIEERFDLDAMFGDIKKARRTKEWKRSVNEEGAADMILEVVTNIGPKRPHEYDYETAAYFGIPPDVITLYQESDSEQELWNEVFWPFFDSMKEAFAMLLPYADLPGEIVVEEDEDDHLALQYREDEGD